MKALLRHQCKMDHDYEGVEIEFPFEVPFFPTVGMHIAPAADADFMKVDEVYWHADRPDEVEVYAAPDARLRPFSYWHKQGWMYSPPTPAARTKRKAS